MEVACYAPVLPPEVLSLIFSYLPSGSQATLCSAASVSRAWYSSAIPDLYCAPFVNGRNFDFFIRAVCPSINAHVRHNGLAAFIRKLDLSYLVHNSSKSLTARLLGRVKSSLEEFIAPQASFGVNCLAALSKCTRLQSLNLQWVSEGIPMFYLLRSIQGLDRLVVLHLSRAASHATSMHQGTNTLPSWPKNLRELHFNGNFLKENSIFLNTIQLATSDLYFEHVPSLQSSPLEEFFEKKGPQVRFVRIAYNQRTSDWASLHTIQLYCTHLQHLSLDCSFLMFAFQGFRYSSSWSSSMSGPFLPIAQVLELDYLDDSWSHNREHDLRCISDGIFDSDKFFPKLRKLLLRNKLTWIDIKGVSSILEEIDSLLKALAREDGENASMTEQEAGVAFIGV